MTRRVDHIVQNEPNRFFRGYYHVSTFGPERSTLRYPGRKHEGLRALSARQRRKTYKQLRREAKLHDLV